MTELFVDTMGWDAYMKKMEDARLNGIECRKHGRQPAETIITTAGLWPVCSQCEKERREGSYAD